MPEQLTGQLLKQGSTTLIMGVVRLVTKSIRVFIISCYYQELLLITVQASNMRKSMHKGSQ